MNQSLVASPKPSAAAYSRLVGIAARFRYVRNAAAIFSNWSKRGRVDSFNCFRGFELLGNDAERDHYLEARLGAIRDAFGAEFIKRVPVYDDNRFNPRGKP